MTSRYAPALFIGLGGSGTKIVRWLKNSMKTESGDRFDGEPVVFRAFDLDPASNHGDDALHSTEYQCFRASAISDCVRALYTGTSGFPEIREWYPDLAGEHISFAQADAAGAGQWRPLGRVGFFLHPNEIHISLHGACTAVDARTSPTEDVQPQVWVISSLGGGTGSGILIDMATVLRQMRPRYHIRAFLLLPELFESIAFKPNLLANTAAALREIAAFTSQRELFTPSYPSPLTSVTPSTATPPFNEVLLIGPYAGRRQPFRNPDDAYTYLAHTIEVAGLREARSGARSDTPNNHLGGIARTDDTSLHVFGSISGLGIPLLTYGELAEFTLKTLADELRDRSMAHPTFDLLRPSLEEGLVDKAIGRLTELVGYPADDPLSKEKFESELRGWIGRWISTNKKTKNYRRWEPETLRQFGEALAHACGLDDASLDSESVLGKHVADARAAISQEIAGLGKISSDPFRHRDWITRIKRRLPPSAVPRPADNQRRPPSIREFVKWLRGSVNDSFLRRPVLRTRVERLIGAIVEYYDALNNDGRRSVYEAAMARAVEDQVRATETSETEHWQLSTAFSSDLLRVLEDPWTERRRAARFVTSARAQGCTEILERELKRFADEGGDATTLRGELLTAFTQAYESYKQTPEPERQARLAKLREAFQKKFVETLSFTPLAGKLLPYVSPESVFEPSEIEALVSACDNPLFRRGQWQGPAGKRIARVVLPTAIVEHDRFMRERIGAGAARQMSMLIEDLCRSSLGAYNATSIAADMKSGAAISILIEDVSHPAQQLERIFDYEDDYRRRAVKNLFHISRHYASLPPLIAARRNQTPQPCGNPGCHVDLRGVPVTAIFCSGCRNPIRTRCGNENCSGDLMSHPAIRRGDIPKHCPACGKPLRTYWWECSEHGAVPIDKRTCPRCVSSRCSAHDVQRRPDDEHLYVCGSCLKHGWKPEVFVGPIVSAIRNGALGTTQSAARTLLDEQLEHGRFCRRCDAAIAPYCPFGSGDDDHLVEWDAERGRFICRAGEHSPLHTCGECGFVLGVRDRTCPRCGERLSDCPYCTPGLLYRVKVTNARCGRCGLNVTRRGTFTAEYHGRDDEQFCTNIYDCRAGADLLHATYPPDTRRCRHCHEDGLPLADVATRMPTLRACEFCSELFGIAHKCKPPRPPGLCCLCGQDPADLQSLRSEPRDWKAALAIGRALVTHPHDDQAAFRMVVQLCRYDAFAIDRHLRDFSRRIKRDAVAHVARKRLVRMLSMFEIAFGCRAHDAADDPCCGSDSGRAGAKPPEERPPAPPDLSAKDLLSPETIVNLDTDEKIDRWLNQLRALRVGEDEIAEARGKATGRLRNLDARLSELSNNADASDTPRQYD